MNFTEAISQVTRLGNVVQTMADRAWNLFAELNAAAGIDLGTVELQPDDRAAAIAEARAGRLPVSVQEADSNSPRPKAAPSGIGGVDWGTESPAKSGGGSKEKTPFSDASAATEREIAMLTAETAALLDAAKAGKEYGSMADYASKKAELLMAAQQQGLTITPELSAQIEKQAQAYATAGMAADDAADKMREIENASERGKDALSGVFGAILEGADSAKEAVANLLAEIAKAQFSTGMMGLLGSAGGGGVTGWLGGLLGGSYDGGGYTGNGSRSGGLDGKGGFLAMMHPRETVTDHTKGQSVGGTMNVHVTVGVDQKTGNLTTFVDQRATTAAQSAAQAMGQQINAGLPARVQQIQMNPRRR